MAGRQVILGPINMPGTDEPGEEFFVTESFTLDPSIGPAARFALVVRNDPLGTGGPNSISFSLNDGFIEEDLPPSGVLVVPVALQLSPTINEINGPVSGPEGHAEQLLIGARDPIGVPQRGTLRLAGGRTSRRITTLLYLAVAGPGRVGFRVGLLDAAGSVLGTTPIRVLRPGASEVVDLTAVASLLGVAFAEGSVGLDMGRRGRDAPVRPCHRGVDPRRARRSAQATKKPERRAGAAHRGWDRAGGALGGQGVPRNLTGGTPCSTILRP